MLKFPGQIVKIETKEDNTIKVVFNTQELTDVDGAELLSLRRSLVWAVFAPTNEITDDDIPKEAIEFKGDKTPSQRLRAVIFVYWQENTDQKTPFDQFYSDYVNKLIEKIKEKLP